MSEHEVSPKVYIVIFLALAALTVLTVVAAGVDAGGPALHLLVALGIALAKATLVVLYFMHARYAGGLTKLVILASVAFYVILVFLTLSDYVTRSWSLTGVS